MDAVADYLDRHQKKHLRELRELLAIPSISTDSRHAAAVRRAAAWVQQRLADAGCTDSSLHETERHPIVYGEWLGAPGRPTLLVYGHYDVQPVDPESGWTTPPFRPTVRDGRIYARGASDDKGQFLAHVNAFGALAANGGCPLNVKFLIEGEEEIGSPNLAAFLQAHKDRLACDVVVVSDTAMFARGVPSICYGLRGLTYLQIDLRGSGRDLHSGTFGGAVVNPANALVEMLASLKDARGRIKVPGFYDRVQRLSMAERQSFASLPHSDQDYKSAIDVPLLWGEEGYTTLERVWARPTLDINGLWAGFTGEGAKTVIPAEAHAKISMRLVPDQDRHDIARKVGHYLKRIAPPSVKIEVSELHGGEPWTTSTAQPALAAASSALRRAFEAAPVFVREGGSIPIVSHLERTLGAPVVLIGFGLLDDNLHAPNEKFELDQFYRGMKASAYLMQELARITGAELRVRSAR